MPLGHCWRARWSFVAAAAAACSSGSTPAAAPPAGSNVAAASSAAGSSTTPQGSATKNIEVCAALPAATVSQIVGTTLTTRRKPAAWRVSCSTASTTDLTQPCCRSTSIHKQVQIDSTSTGRRRRQSVTCRRSSRALVMRHSIWPDPNGNAGSGWCGKFRQLWRRLWRDLHQDRRPDLFHRCPGQADRRGPARQALTRTPRTSGWLARCLVDLPGVSGQLQRLDELLLGEQFVSFDALERT